MKTILNPGIEIISQLKCPQKFWLIGVLVAILILSMFSFVLFDSFIFMSAFILTFLLLIYFFLAFIFSVSQTRNVFIATLAHDLKSPLLSEQVALEYLLFTDDGITEEQFKNYMKYIYNTNKGLLSLVDNLTTVYYYETGRAQLNKSNEQVGEIVEESIQSVKYLADEHSCIISSYIQQGLPGVTVDRIEINRVLINLITNAVKHNPEGTTVNVSAEKVDHCVKVSVQDNGRGISQEIIPEIFQRYPLRRTKIGTGLGLYIAKQIVEAHCGKIWFKTAEGEGTTFYFTLPL